MTRRFTPLPVAVLALVAAALVAAPLVAVALAGGLALSAAPVAAGPLAVGEVIPLTPPPGWDYRPVYARPVMHSRWTPADTSMGEAFREPVHTAPPGYVHRYVRGYALVRLPDPAVAPVVRKPTVKRLRRAAEPRCVTDLGYGRHDLCR